MVAWGREHSSLTIGWSPKLTCEKGHKTRHTHCIHVSVLVSIMHYSYIGHNHGGKLEEDMWDRSVLVSLTSCEAIIITINKYRLYLFQNKKFKNTVVAAFVASPALLLALPLKAKLAPLVPLPSVTGLVGWDSSAWVPHRAHRPVEHPSSRGHQ